MGPGGTTASLPGPLLGPSICPVRPPLRKDVIDGLNPVNPQHGMAILAYCKNILSDV
jgi:hypothetical protein